MHSSHCKRDVVHKRTLSIESSFQQMDCKRRRMESSSCSDSGVSTMSSTSLSANKSIGWPSLVLLSKSNELVTNGRNRRRFPDPVCDRWWNIPYLLASYNNLMDDEWLFLLCT